MVTVVVLQAVVLGAVVGLGAVVLVALALSVRAARVGRAERGPDDLPLVGERHAQFGDATAALRAARAGRAPLRLVRPAAAPSGREAGAARSHRPAHAA